MSGNELHNVLLESGTNELEILVFDVGDQRYGVNVAKVREVINPIHVTFLPDMDANVCGVFQLRERVIPLVDLGRVINNGGDRVADTGRVIIMEFNGVQVGFRVDSVRYIHRISNENVESTPDMPGVREAPITFVVQIDDEIVLMIDFERIIFEITGTDLFKLAAGRVGHDARRSEKRILLAEDSHTMRQIIISNLATAGYTHVTACTSGEETWKILEDSVKNQESLPVEVVVSDIEMPHMDGLRLTRLIKEHPLLKELPIIMFSSLVSPDNQKKCDSVGADAYIAKPQLDLLVELIDGFLLKEPVPA